MIEKESLALRMRRRTTIDREFLLFFVEWGSHEDSWTWNRFNRLFEIILVLLVIFGDICLL
jgi:hypothetical protein